jgi:type II secretion system-associated lipoprotein
VIKSKLIISAFIFTVFISSCTSFIKKDEELQIKSFENSEYVLLQDAGEDDRYIRKGEKVKLYNIVGDDYIKVFCYSSKVDFVKAKRTLILYLFKEDFEKAKFSMDYFKEKLYGKVSPSNK